MNPSPSRRSFQFSLRTILLIAVPWVAALAWIVALDGPYFDKRRVLTHKLGLLILLVDAAFILLLFRAWLGASWRFLAVWLIVFELIAGMILRNRQRSLERQRLQSPPASTVNATVPVCALTNAAAGQSHSRHWLVYNSRIAARLA